MRIIKAIFISIIVMGLLVSLVYYLTSRQFVDGGSTKVNSITFTSLLFNEENTTKLYFSEYQVSVASGIPPEALQFFLVNQKHFTNDGNSLTTLLYDLSKSPSNSHLSFELVRNEYLLISLKDTGKDVGLIAKSLIQEYNNDFEAFKYMPLQGGFALENSEENTFLNKTTLEFVIPLPYHLFQDNSLFYSCHRTSFSNQYLNRNLSHKIKQYYRIAGSLKDFYKFYNSLGMFQIELDNDRLLLTGAIHQRPQEQLVANSIISNGRVTLSFKEEYGINFISYSFEIIE